MRTIPAMIFGGCLAFALGAMFCTSAVAVDQSRATAPTVTELKSRMKALTSEAMKSGDLWTAIQADAYTNQKLGVRTSGVLGASEIIGNPLFAFPNLINAYWDRGDRLIVVSGPRVYQLSPDGYPLGLSIATSVISTYSGLSRDGRYLALIQRVTTPEYLMKVSVLDMSDGSEAWTASVPMVRGDALYGPIHISTEGRSLGFIIYDSNETAPRLQVVRASGKHVSVPGYCRATAIGAEGIWALAEPLSNMTAESLTWSVLSAGKVTEVKRGVSSHGIAAVLSAGPEHRLQIVTAEGAIVEPPQPMTFSRNARLYTTGDWLITANGSAAVAAPTGEPELDLLGNPIVQPQQASVSALACYRWSDLVSPEKAQPVYKIEGRCLVSQLTPGLIFVSQSDKVQSVDLTAATITPKNIPVLGPLEDINSSHGRLIMEYADGKKQIVMEDGTELWSGPARRIVMLDTWHAMVRDEKNAFTLLHLAVDQAQRKALLIDVPDTTYTDFEYDRYDRRLVVSRGSRSWIEYDVQTGKRIAAHEGELRKPIVPTWGSPYGRFSVQAARLVPRDGPAPVDPSVQWNPRDAWRVGSSLIVLDHHGQVYVSARKRGTYTTIGSVDFGYRFGVLGSDMGIANVDGLAVASLAPGPTVVPARPGSAQPMDEMPEGPWKIKQFFYMPPRSPSLIFDPTKCGFTPRVLRSPTGGTTMLMVTDSVVIDVDANFGKAFGIVDKQGLRDLE